MRQVLFIALFLTVLSVSPHLMGAAAINYGHMVLSKGEYIHAEGLFNRVCGYECPLQVQRGQMRAYVAMGDFSDAQSLAKQMDLGSDPVISAWLISTAERLVRSGNRQQAVRVLDLLSQHSHIGAAEVWYRIGEAYERAGATKHAQESYLAGIQHELDGTVAEGSLRLGGLYFRQRDWQAVVDTLAPILESVPSRKLSRQSCPTCREGLFWLIQSLQKLHRKEEAEMVARRLVALEPASHDWEMHFARIVLGECQLARGEYESASTHYVLAYDIAIEVPDNSRESYEERAWSHLSSHVDAIVVQGMANQIKALAQEQAQQYPSSAGWRVLLGLLYEKLDDPSKAFAVYAEALILAPSSVYLPDALTRLCSTSKPPFSDSNSDFCSTH